MDGSPGSTRTREPICAGVSAETRTTSTSDAGTWTSRVSPIEVLSAVAKEGTPVFFTGGAITGELVVVLVWINPAQVNFNKFATDTINARHRYGYRVLFARGPATSEAA